MLVNISKQHNYIPSDFKMNGKHCSSDVLAFWICIEWMAFYQQNTKVPMCLSSDLSILWEIGAILPHAGTFTRNGRRPRIVKYKAMIIHAWRKAEKLINRVLTNQKGTSRQRSGKDAIRKRLPLQKPRWEKTKPTIRYLYHENIS